MIFNIIILLLLLVTIFLILKKNKLFILSLITIIIVSLLSKNIRENFSSLDILYPSNNLQTINQNNMLNKFKDNNSSNILYTNTNQTTSCNNIFDIIEQSKNYILVKQIDNEYYTLNGYIYDLNNSEIYLEKINESTLQNNKNYGLRLNKSSIDEEGFNINLIPANHISGFIQGQNNGNIKLNPIEGNLNSIFYLKNCTNNIKVNFNSETNNIMNNGDRINNVYEIEIKCNNELYLNVSNIEDSINNRKKVVLKSDPSKWYLLEYNSSNINDLYNNI